MDSYQVLSGYKLKETSVFPHCAMILLCVRVCVYTLTHLGFFCFYDSPHRLLHQQNLQRSRGRKKIGKAGGERGVRKREKSG